MKSFDAKSFLEKNGYEVLSDGYSDIPAGGSVTIKAKATCVGKETEVFQFVFSFLQIPNPANGRENIWLRLRRIKSNGTSFITLHSLKTK